MTFSTQRKISAFALGCALIAAAAGCTTTTATEASATPTVAVTSAPAATSAAPAPSASVLDGCPPDVNLLFEWLKVTPAIVDKIDSSFTGLQEPVCYQGWSVARTVVKNADSVLVLFKMDPSTGKWNAVAVGTDNVCDALKVPDAIQAKLGAGC